MAARSGTITVNGQAFTVTQAPNPASCSYTFNKRIEQQAAVDAKFRACLTLVRPSRLTKEILQRLTRAIDYQ
jgi:hypothetical protein